MIFSEEISDYATTPLSYHLVSSLLSAYKRPNDKIHELVKSGQLVSLKKGLYMVGAKLKIKGPEPFLISNHLYGPSYISLDAALSWYGFIPEQVFGVTAVTTKTSRIISNSAGLFEYVHLPLPYYAYGIAQIKLSDDQFVMMACPEKALCDKIITTSGLQLKGIKSTTAYLLEDLRIDEEMCKTLNILLMKEWLENTPKKESLKILINTLEKL